MVPHTTLTILTTKVEIFRDENLVWITEHSYNLRFRASIIEQRQECESVVENEQIESNCEFSPTV